MNSIIINGKELIAIPAITETEQSKGLMFQKWPPPVMFFPYKKSEVRKFWMKNTPSPLDIIFCNDGKIIDIKHGAPLSTSMVGPDCMSDLVIELPHGTSERMGFCIGSGVNIKLSVESAAKFILTGI